MPYTVDYQCDSCDHAWEAWQKNSNDPPTSCPSCDSKEFTRLFGGQPTKCHDPKVRSDILKKRSLDHSARHFRDNFDRERERTKRFGHT